MTEFALPAHGVRDLKLKVARHLEELAREALDNENVDLGLGARIADALWSLVDATADRNEADRSAVRGAIDYFVLNRDETSDIDSRHGLADDARIVNETCTTLGLPELTVRTG
ncbi:MAG: hypothetical protein HY241_13710 [Actinobacteria bacterium]|nr:hypothetical protein [Actinomycetota bacterium]